VPPSVHESSGAFSANDLRLFWPAGEAAGFSPIMAGTRAMQRRDAALLITISPVLERLYASYSVPKQPSRSELRRNPTGHAMGTHALVTY
jgi:hypothetical protein